VDAELRDIDLCDFQDFLEADGLPCEPDPEFETALRRALLQRYAKRR
jgi:hypothetical protein